MRPPLLIALLLAAPLGCGRPSIPPGTAVGPECHIENLGSRSLNWDPHEPPPMPLQTAPDREPALAGDYDFREPTGLLEKYVESPAPLSIRGLPFNTHLKDAKSPKAPSP
jgi:hypothetical protein